MHASFPDHLLGVARNASGEWIIGRRTFAAGISQRVVVHTVGRYTDMNRIVTAVALLAALLAAGCTSEPPDKAASSAQARNKAVPSAQPRNKVEPNPYACNDNMNKDLAQYNLCRGGGQSPR
jgi:outer membrane murein-binding lipoprotein Lpp